MAKGATATPPAQETPAVASTKGAPRPRAAVAEIDWNQAAPAGELKSVVSDRKSVWAGILESLYEGTEAGKAPRVKNDDGSEGELQFVKLGTFNNAGGARTQVKAFEDKHLDSTYEFKTTTAGKQSFLWARVKEVAE